MIAGSMHAKGLNSKKHPGPGTRNDAFSLTCLPDLYSGVNGITM